MKCVAALFKIVENYSPLISIFVFFFSKLQKMLSPWKMKGIECFCFLVPIKSQCPIPMLHLGDLSTFNQGLKACSNMTMIKFLTKWKPKVFSFHSLQNNKKSFGTAKQSPITG